VAPIGAISKAQWSRFFSTCESRAVYWTRWPSKRTSGLGLATKEPIREPALPKDFPGKGPRNDRLSILAQARVTPLDESVKFFEGESKAKLAL